MFAAIKGALAVVKSPPFDIALKGVGHFPPGKRARVLWVGMERNETLTRLAQEVELALETAGVSPEELRLGTVLPREGATAEYGRAMQAVLEGALAAVNEHGGVHGRRLTLKVVGYDADRQDGAEAARRLVEHGDVLALVGGFAPGAEDQIAAVVDAAQVPWIGPFTLFARPSDSPDPYVFHLLSGVRDQARALVEFAAREAASPRPTTDPGSWKLAVVHSEEPRQADAAAAAAGHAKARGMAVPFLVSFPPGRLDGACASAHP